MANTYRIKLEKLQLNARIGIYDHEKNTPQPIEIELILDVKRRFENDDIDTVINYEIIRQICHDVCTNHHHLLETVADQIIDQCYDIKGVENVSCEVKKMDIFDDCIVSIRL